MLTPGTCSSVIRCVSVVQEGCSPLTMTGGGRQEITFWRRSSARSESGLVEDGLCPRADIRRQMSMAARESFDGVIIRGFLQLDWVPIRFKKRNGVQIISARRGS